jgi:hypothetical protein
MKSRTVTRSAKAAALRFNASGWVTIPFHVVGVPPFTDTELSDIVATLGKVAS